MLANGRYRLREIKTPSVYCADIVYFMGVYLINNPDCRVIIEKDNASGWEIRTELSPEEVPYVYIIPPVSSSTVGFYDAAGEEMQFR